MNLVRYCVIYLVCAMIANALVPGNYSWGEPGYLRDLLVCALLATPYALWLEDTFVKAKRADKCCPGH